MEIKVPKMKQKTRHSHFDLEVGRVVSTGEAGIGQPV